jgi:hypothetical protein
MEPKVIWFPLFFLNQKLEMDAVFHNKNQTLKFQVWVDYYYYLHKVYDLRIWFSNKLRRKTSISKFTTTTPHPKRKKEGIYMYEYFKIQLNLSTFILFILILKIIRFSFPLG